MNDRIPPFPADLKLRAPTRRTGGFWVGLLTVPVAACVFFAEWHLSAAPVEQTAVTAAVMVLCCFVMYSSLYDAGRQAGMDTELYRRRVTAYEAVREPVRLSGNPAALDEFCTRYAAGELEETRSRILIAAGLTVQDFLRWQNGDLPAEQQKKLTFSARRILKRARRVRPLKLSAALLLNTATGSSRGHPMLSVRPRKVRRSAVILVPTFAGCLLTVSISAQSVGLTPALLIAGLLRIFTIIWTGVRGYSVGCTTVREDECAALDAKTTLLSAYLTPTAP